MILHVILYFIIFTIDEEEKQQFLNILYLVSILQMIQTMQEDLKNI